MRQKEIHSNQDRYLRRQSLLAADGAPLNFAGCVSHLYYAESSSFAFHALLKEGYFHALCANIDSKREVVLRELMLMMAHLFGRYQGREANAEFVENIIKRSSSVVFLPSMPEAAEKILRAHNEETLAIFRTYVATYVEQHLDSSNQQDNRLPLTNLAIGGEDSHRPSSLSLPPTSVRSRFVALSGHGDDFKSVSELCQTVRANVYLEESVIPYVPLWPDETSIPLNAYLLDFYKHGDISALVNANGISRGNVWFVLNGKYS